MEDYEEKIWLQINTCVRKLAHLKYLTKSESYNKDIETCYDILKSILKTLEGK